MLYTTEALILRTYPLGESDRIVVFLSRDRGKKRGVAKNARQSRRRFGGALEPMTHGRVGYVEREGRDLVFVDYVEPLRSPLAAADAEALGYVGYFAELIDEWAPDGDPNETLFRLGASIVDALAAGVPIEPLARYFEFWLLRLQGVYQPDPRASHEARAFLDAARTSSPFALSAASATPTTLRELEASHRAMMLVHLDKELRSSKVLRAIRRTS
jgi:DNA repair protein RecO (recombination protein O)